MSIFIQKAWYGAADEAAHDVTAAVLALFGSPQKNATFTIQPSTFGLSGLAAKTRYFSMSYTYSSQPGAIVLTRSGADGASWTVQSSSPNATLKIISATYGTKDVFVDITDRMNRELMMSNQASQMVVGSAAFLGTYCSGGDIAPNIQKVLCVYYSDSSNNTTPTICAPDFATINLTFPNG